MAIHERIDALATQVAGLSAQEHGFAHFDADAAHDQADMQADSPPQRLSGWIIPAKDLSDVAGMPTSYGSVHRRVMATETDSFIAKYMAQGAIVPGKSLVPELGLSAYTEPVGLAAPTYDGHTPGGFSGGAAVMVARGLVRAAHASDGGGSIRVPAACTGIVGFKPPHDASRANPVTQGFLTRTLADAAYLHNIRPLSRPLRIGVLTQPVHAEVDVAPHILSAVEEAAARLSAAGHAISRVTRPYGDEPFKAFHDILALKSTKIHGPASPLVEWLRDCGRLVSQKRKAEAVRIFVGVDKLLRDAWDIDVLLTPTLAFDPPPVGYFSAMPPKEDFAARPVGPPWGTMFNMSGGAALSVPYRGVGIQLGAIRATVPELFGVAEAL
ncbi:Amidase [Corynebacterium pseudotuberculosis]|uniref:amidase family protein n=1 Tax=Corynebacterium pseudotuberculosis TaxID=1719 RepID=UPI0009474FB7|nr:amidase [Corynebacterium pseudotuberculosis]APQ55052.1 Amidase [Corynebacterium pseudotuberculosis]